MFRSGKPPLDHFADSCRNISGLPGSAGRHRFYIAMAGAAIQTFAPESVAASKPWSFNSHKDRRFNGGRFRLSRDFAGNSAIAVCDALIPIIYFRPTGIDVSHRHRRAFWTHRLRIFAIQIHSIGQLQPGRHKSGGLFLPDVARNPSSIPRLNPHLPAGVLAQQSFHGRRCLAEFPLLAGRLPRHA